MYLGFALFTSMHDQCYCMQVRATPLVMSVNDTLFPVLKRALETSILQNFNTPDGIIANRKQKSLQYPLDSAGTPIEVKGPGRLPRFNSRRVTEAECETGGGLNQPKQSSKTLSLIHISEPTRPY